MVTLDWNKVVNSQGEFRRDQSSFRNWISNETGAKYRPDKDRYHLYVSYACPWASRTLITRKLKGLGGIISFSSVHWDLDKNGWRFVDADEEVPGEHVVPDPIPGHENFTHIRQVYLESDPEYQGRFTVPILYDKRLKTIVNNESSEIIRMLYTEVGTLLLCELYHYRLKHAQFDHLLDEGHRKVQPYPIELHEQINEVNDWIYNDINNGVYKAGFATKQDAYERNVIKLFEALDKAEAHLQVSKNGPYYFGNDIKEVDIHLYVTVIRFDPVYVQHFKCNVRDIRSGYPYLHKWLRNLYWNHEAFRDTTQFEHIKWHYTKSHTHINPFSISPVGPLPDIMKLDEEVPAACLRLR
ncbi:glutathione S-transferase [Dactylonectria macrodidyma]|uniref:Glutathione S-transferase n=1 Tax=Dactylonectria macrodidyma TaxID=307937 RepID=A0A9P9J9I6_9HYPO|nr:glutathione S-transferase [Dactylonectria macrodidyma]